VENEIESKRKRINWYLWIPRICLLIILLGALLFFILSLGYAFVFIILCGIPLILILTIVFWFKPFAGGILMLVAIPIIVYWYWYITGEMSAIMVEPQELSIKFFLPIIPEVILMGAASILTVIWRKKSRN
jgi:hypothetical protein